MTAHIRGMATVSPSPRITTSTLASSSAGPFELGFRLFEADAVSVFVNDIQQDSGYTLSAAFSNGYDDNATVTFDAALESGDVLTFAGDQVPSRNADYLNTDGLLTKKLNIELARIWASLSEIRTANQRSMKVSVESPVSLDLISKRDARAGRAIAFDETGERLIAGPDSADITAAQGYAESAAASATAAAAYAPYESKSVAEASTVPAPVKKISVIENGVLIDYIDDPDSSDLTTAGGRTWRRLSPQPCVIDFGLFGGIPNSAAAASHNSALLEIILGWWRAETSRGNYEIYFNPARWWFSESHDVSSNAVWRNLKLRGAGRHMSSLETTLSGADSVFLDAGDDRNNSLVLEGLSLITRNGVGTVCPILVKDLNMNEGNWLDMSFIQGSNDQIGGTLTLTSGHWNTDWTDCHSFGGGHYKPANASITEDTTFALVSGDATVICSDAIFTAFDVGRKFLFGSIGGRWVGTVASVTSATEVEMTEASPYTNAAEVAYSEAVRATTTASSNTVTLSSSQASSADIGRIVVIRGAGTVRGARCHHRATITAVPSSNQIILDRAPMHSVSGAVIYFSPTHAIIYDGSSPSENTSNDIFLNNLRMESYHGLGLMIEDMVDFSAVNLKMHGKGTGSFGYIPDNMSQAGMLIKSRGGYVSQGNFEAGGFDDGRVIASGCESFSISDMCGRKDNGQAVLWSEHPVSSNTTIRLGDVTLYNEQHGIDSAGRSLEPMLSGPAGVRQTLIHSGEVVLSSGLNLRVRSGRGAATSPALSVLGSETLFISNGAQDTVALPATSIENDQNQKMGMVAIWANGSGDGVIISYFDNGAGFTDGALVAGNSSIFAWSNTAGATTAGKVTFSVDNDYLYIDNDVGGNRRFNMFWMA